MKILQCQKYFIPGTKQGRSHNPNKPSHDATPKVYLDFAGLLKLGPKTSHKLTSE
jgi:hypothetical protein